MPSYPRHACNAEGIIKTTIYHAQRHGNNNIDAQLDSKQVGKYTKGRRICQVAAKDWKLSLPLWSNEGIDLFPLLCRWTNIAWESRSVDAELLFHLLWRCGDWFEVLDFLGFMGKT